MKRQQPKRRRDRKTGLSPYARHGKTEYRYPFPTGKAARKLAEGRAS